MKGFVWSFLLMLLLSSVNGQNAKPFGAIYRDTVPLCIKSDLFAKASPKGMFQTIAGRIRVSIAERRDYVLATAFIDAIERKIKNLDSLQLQKIEYRVSCKDGSFSNWKSVKQNKTLLDTILSLDEMILLEFRFAGQTRVIQQTKIIRVNWEPTISAIRTINTSDTFNKQLTAKSVYENIRLPKGFKSIMDSNLILSPDKELELAVISHTLNEDSCIEVKIIDKTKSEPIQWRKTGHLVTIKSLAAGRDYFIETRYRGEIKQKLYNIHVALFWWQETWAIVCFVLAGFSLIVMIVFLLHRKKVKQKERKIEMGINKCIKEQSKLDTHLVDNIFHSALGLIRNNQNELAEEYLGNASGFLRDKLINSEKIIVPFRDDMKSLEKFISNEQIKLGFRYSLNIDRNLEIDKIMLPPLLWQPSLENSIKHGMNGKDGFIEINIWRRRNDLWIMIRDNGKFIPKPVKPGAGFGIPITRERIIGLNMAYSSQKIEYEVERLENETIVSFIFRNWVE